MSAQGRIPDDEFKKIYSGHCCYMDFGDAETLHSYSQLKT